MKKLITSNLFFFFLPFFAASLAASYLVFFLQFVYPDALSRSFHSYAVFFASEPKFANIGFVWPPLPTLAALPLSAIKPLNTFGLTGNILSAIFLSITCLYLNRIFKFFNITTPVRLLLTLLFILNPMILLYGSNGMSEMIAISFFTATIFYFINFIKTNHIPNLIAASIATSAGIMTRYEMASLVPTIALLLAIFSYVQFKKNKKKLSRTIEQDVMLFGMPILFTIAIWIFANWAIMHNPFYFVTSVYSNASQAGQLVTESSYYRSLAHNLIGSLAYSAQRVIVLFPGFLVFAAIIITKLLKKQNWKIILAILSLPFAIVAFHTLLLYTGQSFGWLRFFIYIIPAAMVLSAYIIAQFAQKKSYTAIVAIVLLINFVSSVSSFFAMSDPRFGKEESRVVTAVTTQNTGGLDDYSYAKNLEIAEYLNANVTDGRIIVDDFTGFSIIYLSGNSELFIQTLDKNFDKTLRNLATDNHVHYILVRQHGGLGDLDAINRTYPSMYENGAGIATLEKDFGTWRLYKKTTI